MEVVDMEQLRDNLVNGDDTLRSVIIALADPQTHGLRQAVRELKSILNGHRQRLDDRIEAESPPEPPESPQIDEGGSSELWPPGHV